MNPSIEIYMFYAELNCIKACHKNKFNGPDI
jgi:hypothetical protein